MDLASKKVIKKLLKKHGIRPRKRFGQNFLISKQVLKKIITSAELSSADTILEIGPGIGTLTQELAKRVKRVIAIEKDPKMVEILSETLKDFKNVKIIQGDILKFDLSNPKHEIRNPKQYQNSNDQNPKQCLEHLNFRNSNLFRISDFEFRIYKVVANLPYYIVSPVIRKFLESAEVRPRQMVLMVQKEVAQRITAKPPKMNLLAVSVQFYAEPKIISYVSKKSFWPQPKVDGAIIKIVPKKPATKPVLVGLFFKIVRAGFSHPRKQLINNLSKKLKIDRERVKNWLLKNKIDPRQRAETLGIKDWICLAKSYKNYKIN